MINEHEILFVIATYKDKYFECESYKRLVESFNTFGKNNILNIYVADNTNVPNWNLDHPKHSENVNINYHHFPTNPGLPYVYNKSAQFATDNNFKWIVFLDQDTKLPNNFYQEYVSINQTEVIYCPLVFSEGKLMSPSAYKFYRSAIIDLPSTSSIALSGHSCINSGLLLRTDFFMKIDGYNDRLFLDFADHDFIEKVYKSGIKKLGIINVILEQDFSSNTHNKLQAIGRYRTFVKDLLNFKKKRNKVKIFFYVDLPHVLKLTIQYRSLAFAKIRFLS